MKYLRIDGFKRYLNPLSELTSGELFSESVFYIGMIGMLVKPNFSSRLAIASKPFIFLKVINLNFKSGEQFLNLPYIINQICSLIEPFLRDEPSGTLREVGMTEDEDNVN